MPSLLHYRVNGVLEQFAAHVGLEVMRLSMNRTSRRAGISLDLIQAIALSDPLPG